MRLSNRETPSAQGRNCDLDGYQRRFCHDYQKRARIFAVVIVDITDRKRAEEEIKRIRRLEGEMRQASRTEMMGGLTASLAHELNQPLQRSGLMRKLHAVCLLRTGRSCAR